MTASVDLLVVIKERIGDSTPEVREKLIAGRVDKEVGNRVATLDKALIKLAELKKEEKKLAKPDIEGVLSDGTVAQSHFTPKAYETWTKHKAKMAKLDKAIDEALNNSEFHKLGEVLKKS